MICLTVLICMCKFSSNFVDCSMSSKKIVDNSISIEFDVVDSMLKGFVRSKNRSEQKNKIDKSIVKIVEIVELIDIVGKKISDVLIERLSDNSMLDVLIRNEIILHELIVSMIDQKCDMHRIK